MSSDWGVEEYDDEIERLKEYIPICSQCGKMINMNMQWGELDGVFFHIDCLSNKMEGG